MLRSLGSLIFPRLIHKEDVKFKSWTDDSKTTGIYVIDWDYMDDIKKKRFLEHNQRCNPPEIEFPGTLPEKYDIFIKNLEYAIPAHYLDEIRRCSKLACFEWGTERHFDTMIREICLEPAISYAFVAFRMIADCLYDSNSNYFYRGPDKILVPQALLYKFWSFQCGRGNVKEHSWFHKLDFYTNRNIKEGDDSTCYNVRMFIHAINEYEANLEKFFSQIVDTPVVVGPSIENNEKFDLKCVEEKDLDFKGHPNQMGLELLRYQWINGRKNGIFNINCGYLRRIGKTTFIKELIRAYKRKVGDKYFIVLLLPNSEVSRDAYSDLLEEKSLNFIFDVSQPGYPNQTAEINPDKDILYFSDEIPDAEYITLRQNKKFKTFYIGGMYSSSMLDYSGLPKTSTGSVTISVTPKSVTY